VPILQRLELGHHVVGALTGAARPTQSAVRQTYELGRAAQDVRDVVLHAVPASDFVLRSHPAGRWLARFIVIDLVLPLDLASRAGWPAVPLRPVASPSIYECETDGGGACTAL